MIMHFISLAEAAALNARYRQHHENILKEAYQGQNILPLSETFDRYAVDTVLEKPGCTGLRVYYGMTEDLAVHAVMVGVDENNRDILPVTTGTSAAAAGETDEEDGFILERAIRCPDLCPDSSPLNSDGL